MELDAFVSYVLNQIKSDPGIRHDTLRCLVHGEVGFIHPEEHDNLPVESVKFKYDADSLTQLAVDKLLSLGLISSKYVYDRNIRCGIEYYYLS